MNVAFTKEFVKMLGKLPQDIRGLYLKQEEIFKNDWRDPRLHLKKLGSKPITFSFRITRAYRAFFYFRAFDAVILYAVGHRKDIHRKL